MQDHAETSGADEPKEQGPAATDEGRQGEDAPPPTPKRRPWILAAVAAAVLLLFLILILILVFWPRKEYLYQRSPKYRRKLLVKFKAHKETMKAVNDGLKWLADHQVENGSWAPNEMRCPDDNRCSDLYYSADYTDAVTGLALLAFLGRGISETPEDADDPAQQKLEKRFSTTVKKATDDLLKTQSQEDGSWGDGYMYAQGICTLALIEAEALSKRKDLKPRIEKGLAFITKSQSKEGGWDYYGQGKHKGNLGRSDTSITAWVLLALMSARSAGYEVPDQVYLQVLNNCHRVTDPETQWVGYDRRGGGTTRTCLAIGLFARLYLGYHPLSQPVETQAKLILQNHVPPDYYFWYHASVAMFQVEASFPEWNSRVQYSLIGLQSRNRHMTGSWDGIGEYEKRGGRVLTTALCVMSLEVYFRHLLLYGEGAEQFPAPYAIVAHFPKEKDKAKKLMYLSELGSMVADGKVFDFLKDVAGKDPDEEIRKQAKASLDRLRKRRKREG